jgi:protein TonB
VSLTNAAVAALPQEAPPAAAAGAPTSAQGASERDVPPEPAAPRVVTTPDWAAIPNGEDFARYYPYGAQKAHLSGYARIGCQVMATGQLTECKVLAEDPADWDFGAAALKLSQLFKMRPTTRDGASVAGATVRIPIRFEIFGEN